MRTTITLDDNLLEAAKRRAAERGVTLSRFVEDALRTVLSATASPPKRRFELVTFHGTGARAGIDLDRTSELLAIDDVDSYAR